MFTFKTGTLIFVEGDRVDEWWQPLDWQAREFLKAMRFGEMKSMGGCVQPTEYTDKFKQAQFEYRFIIEDGYGHEPSCYLENLSTGKKREIKFYHLGKEGDMNNGKIFRKCDIKVTR
jgi:hypothetical protein